MEGAGGWVGGGWNFWAPGGCKGGRGEETGGGASAPWGRGEETGGGASAPRCTLTFPFLVPQLLWHADAERKKQCSFKGKNPEVSQHLEVTWAEGGLEVVGLGPRMEARGGSRCCQLWWKGHGLLRWPDPGLCLDPVLTISVTSDKWICLSKP